MKANKYYSKEELIQFQAKINTRTEEIKHRLSQYEEKRIAVGGRDQANQSYGDAAKADQQLSRISAIQEQSKNELKDLRTALFRIENGTFGIDLDAGTQIPKAQLLANLSAVQKI